MSGDYSRFTFKPEKDYSAVRKQQGRVDLDSDWNELVEIVDRRWRSETIDLVGRGVVPSTTHDAFLVTATALGAFDIGVGRMYVDGIQVENHGLAPDTYLADLGELRGTNPVPYDSQPYLPQAPDLSGRPGATDLVYLDVWQREVTVLEDPSIREIALGGPDTATRVQAVWQVRVLQGVDDVGDYPCGANVRAWDETIAPSAGRLTTSVVATPASDDPCIISPAGGYRGLENRLYRLEIHSAGGIGGRAPAKFKWSRNNATIASSVTAIPTPTQITVQQIGRDQVLRFDIGNWIEVTDDFRELQGLAGHTAQVTAIDEANHVITFEPALPENTFDPTDPSRHARVRRWDQSENLDANGLLDVTAEPIDIEDGIRVTFTVDPIGGSFKIGDYWVFSARTADGSVEPLQEAPPSGILHHFCRLGFIKWGRDLPGTSFTDCRECWPPLASLTRLSYLEGTGQEGMPKEVLACPLQVGVTKCENPADGASVRFTIPGGSGGALLEEQDGKGAVELIVSADAFGVAQCWWELPDEEPRDGCLVVEARLLDAAANPVEPPIRFTASLSLASRVSYDPKDCPDLRGVATVQEAIDELCKREGEAEDGIRINAVLSNTDRNEVRNDRELPVDRIADGLRVVCDREIDPFAFGSDPERLHATRRRCRVILDLPYPLPETDEADFWGSHLIGYQPLTMAAEVSVTNNEIVWIPDVNAHNFLLNTLFPKVLPPVLGRLILNGNFIWSRDVPPLYLDGDAFGKASLPPETRVDLDLANGSGDGRRGGTFEMWFWLVPAPDAGDVERGGCILEAKAEGLIVRGTVRDESGSPLSAIPVQLLLDGRLVAELTTDASGSFKSKDLHQGRYTVVATCGHEMIKQDVTVGRPLNPADFPGRVVTDIPGVGNVLASRLESRGITHPAEVANLDAARLAEVLEVSPARAEALILAARKLLSS